MSAGRRGKASGGWRPGPKPGSKADRWRRSPEFRAIANKALAEFNERRSQLPKCGAKTKGTGEPCRRLALENGRCKFHGGLTPRGDQWHKIRLPERGEAGGVEKFDRKLIAKEKAQAERKRRLAAMTPEQRARHEAWQAAHRPGKAADRAYARQQRETGRMLAKLLADADEKLGRGHSPMEDVFS